MYAYSGHPGSSVSRVYVCNLHPDVSEATLYEKFSRAGPVVSIKVFRDQVTRSSLGYAYVNFQQPADAVCALDTMDFDVIRDRPCRITWHDPSILLCSGIGKIFIKHLDKAIDNKTLFNAFSTFGNILSCEVAQNEMGESKGYGFVHFETQEAADTAIKKVHGMLLNGKKVFIEKFKPRNRQTRMVSTPEPRDRRKEERLGPLSFQRDNPLSPCFPAPPQPHPLTPQNSMYCGTTVPMGWTQAQQPYFHLMQYPGPYLRTPPPMMGGAMHPYGQSYYNSGGRGSSMTYGVMPPRPQRLSACDYPSPLYLAPPTMSEAPPTMSGGPPTMSGGPPTMSGAPPTMSGAPPTMSGPIPPCQGPSHHVRGPSHHVRGPPAYHVRGPSHHVRAPPTMPGAPPTRVKYTPGFRNRPAPQVGRNRIPPVDLPASTVMQGITLPDLAAMTAQEQKQFLGENLYTRIISIDPLFQDMDLAGKITGMLLEMDNTDLLHLLESQDALREKVQEAIAVLEAHIHKENTSQLSAAAMAAARSHISPVDLPASTVMQGITLSDLAAVPPQERKQFLGEHLYTRIRNIDPLSQDADLAGKITGMLLEMNNTDLLHLLESQDALRDKAQEAIDVLGAHEQQKSAATPISTAKFCAVVRNHPALQACKQKESTKGEQSTVMPGYPQDYADLAFHFVERPPEWLICAVCQELALDPVQAICCGKMYCANCIESWKTKSNSCPTCRSTPRSNPPFNVFQDRNAHQRITSLAVYCPNQCNGCNKMVELSELENHLTSDNGCPFQVVECSNECGHSAWRSHMSKHMATECHLRSEQCQSLVPTHDIITGVTLGERPKSSLEQEVRLQEQVSPQEQEVIPQEQEASHQEGNIQDQEVGFQEQEVSPQELQSTMDDLSGKLENITL